MRRFLILGTALAALAASTPSTADPVGELSAAPARTDQVWIRTVLPPGQDGLATLDPATQEVRTGPHFLDQLDMYGRLVFEDTITAETLDTFFKDENFSVVADPSNVERVEVLAPGLNVYRDTKGVPHVYGQTAEEVAFGAGYVTAEDRMFESDLFRRAAKGTLAELLGPAYLQDDLITRRDGYTEAELQEQITNLPQRFGVDGVLTVRALEAFSAGFNRRIVEAVANPTLLPVEYAGTGNAPVPWRPTDTVALGVLLARRFGEAAGAETRNAALLNGLRTLFDPDEAARVFDDLRVKNDPGAATTVPSSEGRFDYPALGPADPAAIALPDHAAAVYRGEVNELARVSALLGDPLAQSNAMLIGPSESETGNSLQLGDPQVEYSVPQYLMEIGLHGGGFDVSGMTFPGVSLVVLIGHGPDYAWTVTSGISDAVDVRAERLCDPTGGTVDLSERFYVYKGKCTPMEVRVETAVAKNSAPPILDPSSPQADAAVLEIERTVHGPVFARDTVDGAPVALVKERAFWMNEFDNAAAFGLFNFPDRIRNAADFFDAASRLTVSLNLYYADQDTIGYWHTGRFPKRTRGVDPRLPSWGTGLWEWQGMIPFTEQPHMISSRADPATQDWATNWNNKPAVGWDNGDDTQWGAIQRVDALRSRMAVLLDDDDTMNRVDVIQVMNDAATVDPRVAKLWPVLESRADGPADDDCDRGYCLPEQALALLDDYADAGGHRIDRDDNGSYDDGAAIRLWDAWNKALVERIFMDEVDPVRGLIGYDDVDEPGPGGSAFFDGFFSQVYNELRSSGGGLSMRHDWIPGSKDTVVYAALEDALAELGVETFAELTALTMPREEIVFTSFGASEDLRIHWVNRGTWTHVAELTGRR